MGREAAALSSTGGSNREEPAPLVSLLGGVKKQVQWGRKVSVSVENVRGLRGRQRGNA